MMDFEEVLERYEPMISAVMRKLTIYRNHEQFRQVGRIALWQAWQRFDKKKGNFTAYAFMYIRGAMLDELKKERKFTVKVLQVENDVLERVGESQKNFQTSTSHRVAEALLTLKQHEQELIQMLFMEGYSLSECAVHFGISIAGIKKRRERIIKEIRRTINTNE